MEIFKKICIAFLLANSFIKAQTSNTYPLNGNVGIGTTTPQSKLQISGGKLLVQYNQSQFTSTALDDINGNLGSNGIVSNFGGDLHLRDFHGIVIDKNGGGWSGDLQGSPGYSGVNPQSGCFAVRTRIGNTQFRSDFIIRFNGNIGIGTTNPETKVDIQHGDDIGLRIKNANGNGISFGVKYQLNYPIWPANQYDSYIYAHQTNSNTAGGNLAIANASSGKSIKFITTRASTDPNPGNQGTAMEILPSGQVVIYEKNFTGNRKASATAALLSVDGEIHAKKVVVTNAFADYVFEKDYKLLSLEELETYISKNHRLPNLPSAVDVEKNGLDTGEILRLQMEKIEELTLYLLEQKKEIENLKSCLK
ncbi:MAG: hypothetical protein EAZ27_09645 [Cytophagales bacterium]|nr:MAG: hypothetical protein EAZ27_09645 [Cytophagales bacterium]